VPPNCQFYVDDIESDWPYTSAGAFDYIHGRGLGGSVKDWRRLYRNAHDNLKPEGWMGIQEWCITTAHGSFMLSPDEGSNWYMAKRPRQKTLSWYQLEQRCECIEPFTLAPLTRYLGSSKEETQVLMAGVRTDFRNRENHLYCSFHYVYGQKPMATN